MELMRECVELITLFYSQLVCGILLKAQGWEVGVTADTAKVDKGSLSLLRLFCFPS